MTKHIDAGKFYRTKGGGGQINIRTSLVEKLRYKNKDTVIVHVDTEKNEIHIQKPMWNAKINTTEITND